MATDNQLPAGFEDYFRKVFADKVTFKSVLKWIQEPKRTVLIFNPKDKVKLKDLWEKAGLKWKTLAWYPEALVWPNTMPENTPLPGFKERFIYAMNPSSVLPVIALGISTTDKMLDACAAPGGKSLVISQYLGSKGQLTANDISGFRRTRMKQLFKAYGRHQIRVQDCDARILYQKYPNYFDKILADVPCSSEKHLFLGNGEGEWSIARIQQNQKRQIEIVLGLVKALKKSGILVYSTCALSPLENEVVCQKVLDTLKSKISLMEVSLDGLPTEPGVKTSGIRYDLNLVRRILPDKDYDPMFVAKFIKK